jgi:hypothetical protein
MRHFGVVKTLDVLHEHFYWLKMKNDMQCISDNVNPRKNKCCLNYKLTTWEIKVKKFMHTVK